MSCYNQHDYPDVPYPHRLRPRATVKTAGCGVCCLSMAVEKLTGERFPPAQAARFAIDEGARLASGTDMVRLGKAACRRFGFVYGASNDVHDVLRALDEGAAVIANVGGDRPGHTGLFSSGGHYVYVQGCEGGRLVVWDPGYYPGKFDTEGRRGFVEVRGDDVLTAPEMLDADCLSRWPRYYIFREEQMTQKEFDRLLDAWLARRGELGASDWAAAPLAAAVARGVTDGSRPRAFATREEVAAMVLRAAGNEKTAPQGQ